MSINCLAINHNTVQFRAKILLKVIVSYINHITKYM